MQVPNLFVAFIAGLLSFLSPCVLPLVPAYIGYLGGTTVIAARASALAGNGSIAASKASVRWTVMTNAFLFVLGFTLVFVVVIGGLAGALSETLSGNRLVGQVMGVVLIVLGLQMIGAINIPFLNYTRRVGDQIRPMGNGNASYIKSLLIGMGFAAGWTPCIGPTLGLVLTLGKNGQQWEALLPAFAYSLGLGIPFLITAMAMGQVSTGLKKLTRRMYSLKLGRWTVIDQVNIISLISGALIIFMGVLVATDALTLLNQWFPILSVSIFDDLEKQLLGK